MSEPLQFPTRHPGISAQEFRRDPTLISGACFVGPVEHYRRALQRSTEASDNYHFACFMTAAAVTVGRRAYVEYGRRLYPSLYSVLVGSTGSSRKSTAISCADELLRSVGVEYERSSTGSTEGVLQLLEERRPLLLTPGEFRTLHSKANAKGTASLLSFMTEVYDCPPSYRHKTVTRDYEAANPFLAILTASTPSWLLDDVQESDVGGGYLNRFLIVDGLPKPPIPFPDPPIPGDWDEASRALADLSERLKFAPVDDGGELVSLAPDARDLWRDFYSEHQACSYESELLASMSVRIPDTAMKLALLYALLRGADAIEARDLDPAVVFARWQRRAHTRTVADVGVGERAKLDRKVKEALKELGGDATRTELRRKIGGRVADAETFNRSIRALDESGEIHLGKTERGGQLIRLLDHDGMRPCAGWRDEHGVSEPCPHAANVFDRESSCGFCRAESERRRVKVEQS